MIIVFLLEKDSWTGGEPKPHNLHKSTEKLGVYPCVAAKFFYLDIEKYHSII
jgi:hypothetical protein